MDKSFQRFISCGVCLELFDQAPKRPRILSCGHTFCHACMDKILSQSPSCPKCAANIQFTTVESIPINFSLESLSSLGMDVEGCEAKTEPNYELLKKQICLRVDKELKERTITTAKIKELLKVLDGKRNGLIEDLRNCEKQMEELESLDLEENKTSENLKQLQTMVETSQSGVEISPKKKENALLNRMDKIKIVDNPYLTPLSIESLENLCKEGVYALETKGGKFKYGKVAVKDGRVWVSCFSTEKPQSRLIPFQELLFRFNSSPALPKTTYIEFSGGPPPRGTNLQLFGGPSKELRNLPPKNFVVVMETDGVTPRAKNFILLCSFLKGLTFKGMTIKWFDFGGPTSCGIDYGHRPVTVGIGDDDGTTSLKEGDVYGTNGENSWFLIQVKDQLMFPSSKFGVVVAGLQNLREIQRFSSTVLDCGLVI